MLQNTLFNIGQNQVGNLLFGVSSGTDFTAYCNYKRIINVHIVLNYRAFAQRDKCT